MSSRLDLRSLAMIFLRSTCQFTREGFGAADAAATLSSHCNDRREVIIAMYTSVLVPSTLDCSLKANHELLSLQSGPFRYVVV